MLLEGRGGGGLKVVVIFGREGQGWGGWGHRRHGRGVGKLGALQEACSGNPPRDVNALSKRGPNPNPPENHILLGSPSWSSCRTPGRTDHPQLRPLRPFFSPCLSLAL